MRQLQLTVPVDDAGLLDDVIARHDTFARRAWSATGEDDELRYVECNVSNGEVGELLLDLEEIETVTVTMAPRAVLALRPGRGEAPEDLIDVENLSGHEVYLGGLQSVGSWSGFLGYAVFAGAVAWIGMLVNSVFLLIAAMLIAPFAGPAMNAALSTAIGDTRLLGRSLARYLAAIVVLVAVAAGLHLVLGTDVATASMTETAKVSSVAALLPLVAGAAGALNLVQAERSSLVSGAATGVLVAAALAPPAALVGMASVIGAWQMAKAGVFLLCLQLVGINLAGSIVFWLHGVRPDRARFQRGSRPVLLACLAASAVALGGLVTWQLLDSPSLQRSSVESEIGSAISTLVEDEADVELVEVDARFTRPEIPGQDTLLATVHVQPVDGVAPTAELEDELASRLAATISDDFGVTALVSVTAIAPP